MLHRICSHVVHVCLLKSVHGLLEFGIYPLPETLVVEKMFTLGLGQRLIIFEVVAADGTVIRFATLITLLLLRLAVLHLRKIPTDLCFYDVLWAALGSELQDLVADAHHFSFAMHVPDRKESHEENHQEAEQVNDVLSNHRIFI